MLICGALSMTCELPFGLMLGVSRRGYYLGTALLVAILGVAYGLGLTLLLPAVFVVTATRHWASVGHFFETMTAPALTGVLAAIVLAMGLGGLTTMRRITI